MEVGRVPGLGAGDLAKFCLVCDPQQIHVSCVTQFASVRGRQSKRLPCGLGEDSLESGDPLGTWVSHPVSSLRMSQTGGRWQGREFPSSELWTLHLPSQPVCLMAPGQASTPTGALS